MNELIQLDHTLFRVLNGSWTNSFFDWLLPRITDLHKTSAFAIAVLILIAFWIWRRRGAAVYWVIILALSIGLSDLFAYRIVKKNHERPRPQFVLQDTRLLTHQHSGDSFPSNHATNMFAAATVLSAAFPPFWPIFYFIAVLIGYSRIYVGVHFPLDVIGGALIGLSIAHLIIWLGSKIRARL